MINLPMIPYLLFFTILVLGIVTGVLKGWKTSLYFLFGQIISIGIIVGIYIGIQDSVIKLALPLLKNKMTPNLNYNGIINLMKVPVGAIFVSILLLPINIILIIVWLFIRKRVNKYLKPEIINISSNSNKIIVKNTTRIRIIGGLMGFVSSLTIGSIVTSASTFYFVKTDKQNWFTKFTDSISSLTTFGKFKNTTSFKYIYDYMPLLKNKNYVNQLKQLFSLTSTTGKLAIDQNTLKNISAFNKKHELLTKRVFSKPGSAVALITAILKQLNSYPIEVIENKTDLKDQGDRFIKKLQTFIEQNKKQSLGFGINSKEVESAIKNKIEQSLQKFESTNWFQNYKNAFNSWIQSKKDLKLKQENFDNKVHKLKELINQRNKQIDIMISKQKQKKDIITQIPKHATKVSEYSLQKDKLQKQKMDNEQKLESLKRREKNSNNLKDKDKEELKNQIALAESKLNQSNDAFNAAYNKWKEEKNTLDNLNKNKTQVIEVINKSKDNFKLYNNLIGSLVENHKNIKDKKLSWIRDEECYLRDIDLTTFKLKNSRITFANFNYTSSSESIWQAEVDLNKAKNILQQKEEKQNELRKIKDENKTKYNRNKEKLLELIINLLH
ncbi:MAG: hypothetical protein GY679_02955 [Mycoplasma sp.]|nr:hypothetical protein [Mycoplasma sp.]